MYIWVCKKCFTIEMSWRVVNPNEKGSILFEIIKVLWGLVTYVLQGIFIEENQWVCLSEIFRNLLW